MTCGVLPFVGIARLSINALALLADVARYRVSSSWRRARDWAGGPYERRCMLKNATMRRRASCADASWYPAPGMCLPRTAKRTGQQLPRQAAWGSSLNATGPGVKT